MTTLVRQTFDTYFGNAVLGFYINWATDAASWTASTDTLTATCTLNMYSVNMSTSDDATTPGLLDKTSSAYSMTWYVSWLMSQASPTALPFDSTHVYDAAVGALDITVTDGGGVGVAADGIAIDWAASDPILDKYCTDANCSTVVTDTSDNIFTTVAETLASGMCRQTFTVTDSNALICNQIVFTFTRPWTATDTSAGEDQDLTLRKYQVTAGWDVNASASAPAKQDFAT
jgi:hypothetical protein